MVEQVVRLTVDLTVHEGQLETFKSIAAAMTEVSKSEPGTLGYEWFASSDSKQFRLVETYTDAAAVEAHFTGPAVMEWVPKLAAVCSVDGMEFYGDPGPKVTAMAGGFGAVFFQYWLGNCAAETGRPAPLLLQEVDGLVLVARDARANLCRRFAQLGLLVGVESLPEHRSSTRSRAASQNNCAGWCGLKPCRSGSCRGAGRATLPTLATCS